MALKGINVLEFAGLAPAPFCGLILADFGARVVRIDRMNAGFVNDVLCRGKQSIKMDLKHPQSAGIVKRMCTKFDVLIDPFRPGVMEKFGLGPQNLMLENPHLIYTRLSGFGQNGLMSKTAGHDINFLATSGILSKLGYGSGRPFPPINLFGDFASGGLLSAFGIMMALYERMSSGRGQIIDGNMTAGSAYVGSWLWKSQNIPFLWGKPRGQNLLDGGMAFYDTYETADHKYMAVGALEPQFYSNLLKTLDLDEKDFPQAGDQDTLRDKLTEIFKSKDQKYWTEKFQNVDACVNAVLSLEEAAALPHNQSNQTFMRGESGYEPTPSPTLSRTPAINCVRPDPEVGEHTLEILKELDYTSEEIQDLLTSRAVGQMESKL